MKIDWSFVLILIFGIASTVCVWCADLFLDDMQLYADIKIGSAYFLIAMLFVLFDSFNNKRLKEIAELKKEVEELRNCATRRASTEKGGKYVQEVEK